MRASEYRDVNHVEHVNRLGDRFDMNFCERQLVWVVSKIGSVVTDNKLALQASVTRQMGNHDVRQESIGINVPVLLL